MQDKIELEYRVQIPIKDYDFYIRKFKKVASIKSRKKRFSIMFFFDNKIQTSVVYLRTTIDLENKTEKTEFVHKKGKQHAVDRKETSIDIPSTDFIDYFKVFGDLSTSKTVIMQRHTVNLITEDGIVISIVKSRNYAYVEFEKLCNCKDKEVEYKKLHNFIKAFDVTPMNAKEYLDFMKTLDEKSDKVITGKEKEIEKTLQEYQEFRFS